MAVVKSVCYVIKTFTINDADRVAVVLTESGLKKSLIAKNGARLKSAVAGKLELFNFIEAEWYEKEGQKLHPLNHASVAKSYFKRISGDMARFMAFSFYSELADLLVHGEEGSPKFYRLLTHTFDFLEDHDDLQVATAYFMFWSLKLLGVFPAFESCVQCGKLLSDVNGFGFSGEKFCCNSCCPGLEPLPGKLAARLADMSKLPLSKLTVDVESDHALVNLCNRIFTTFTGRETKSFPLMIPFVFPKG
ncbi:MAG: DNA repair protein RecO [Holophagae bacterium]|nr:DNA repair protein RecO [Holophagae bacterium]